MNGITVALVLLAALYFLFTRTLILIYRLLQGPLTNSLHSRYAETSSLYILK